MLRIGENAQPIPRKPGVFLVPPTTNADREAWKKLIGSTVVPARLDPLPQAKTRWSALLASTLFQAVLTALLIFVPVLFPGNLVNPKTVETIFLAPRPEITLPQTQPAPHPKILSPPPAVLAIDRQPSARLIAPRLLAPAVPKPAPVKTVDVSVLTAPYAELNFQAPSLHLERPREDVKLGTLSTGNEVPLETSKRAAQVQTGGFGDPNGLPADSSDKRGSIVRAGFASLPPGLGYGNGTGGLSGARGAVAKVGFGEDAETSSVPRRSGAVVKSSGFEAATEVPPGAKIKEVEASPPVQPVVILEKPNAVYSDEARKLGLEGEVLVDVIFVASGEVRVLRVTRGLGHGLDEAAKRAAQQMRFKPALQDGKAVDFPATVHIQFELAF